MTRLLSYRTRPAHLGPYPLERLARQDGLPDLAGLDDMARISFRRPDDPASIVNAMRDYQAMMDATRDGRPKPEKAEIPRDPDARAAHLKAFAYYVDASMAGTCTIPPAAWLDEPLENPDIALLADRIDGLQPKSFASGVDGILADLRQRLATPPDSCRHHSHALVILVAYPRDPAPNEPGCDWIHDAQPQRACLRGAEMATTLATYIRLLGFEARAHDAMASDVHLGRLAVAAGLAEIREGRPWNPFLGNRFGLAAVTTTMALAPDRPLRPGQSPGLGWRSGLGRHASNALNHDPYRKRAFKDGPHPFETLKRVDTPTTLIDGANVARVPKRANMFARALFGDLGHRVQQAARNGNYVRKSAAAFAFRPSLGAFMLLQYGDREGRPHPSTSDPARNAANIKGAAYFLGMDAVGLSECPDYAYYSHDTTGAPITPYHGQAISMIVDQGHETMEGASGDDWIACAQSMRAYLRFSLIGGVIAQQLRNLGREARVHSVMDDEVLNPPLLLLSGLGEVSRIGEVILNPFLGPRLKSGVVTTDMPMDHDRPIDFGLQRFCDSCNKCARECPSGAITAGPKLMFNGYEIWKSDSSKCLTYRVAQEGGAMCGRCMKTCPWNLEGVLAESPFRWAAMHLPGSAGLLARLDDIAGRGEINPVKKWWWDIEMRDEGPYRPPAHPVNARSLSRDLKLRPEDQTLAVYPAPLAPPPWPWPFPMDREAGIRAYRDLIDAREYRRRRAAGLPPEHVYSADRRDAPVMQVEVAHVERLTDDIAAYGLRLPDGAPLPPFQGGAHIEIVVAPEYFRQYSLCSDPARRETYEIAVLREDRGRGGSQLLHRIFVPGRRVFISHPRNHFPLAPDAEMTFLMGGGIGVTPMIAMAHQLHAQRRAFALHYSVPTRSRAAFAQRLARTPWADRVHLHVSDEGTRADLRAILRWRPGSHVYACGPDSYMQAVLEAAADAGFPEDSRHVEYFAPPRQPEYENHPFTLRLLRSGRDLIVPADRAATDVLAEAGIRVDVKCRDGICGVCRCTLVSGEVEHRDFVLSDDQRRHAIILCQSRAARPGGIIEIDL